VVGFAPSDPQLPAALSVREYLEHSARLCHGSHARASTEAQRMLEELELADLARLPLAQLVPHQTRALGIAVAALTAPAVVCLESPLRGLDSASADYITRLCAHVALRRVLIVSGGWPQSPSPERALFEACDALFHVANSALVAQGSPQAIFKPSARYLLTLAGSQHSALASTLTSAGCELRRQTAPITFSALLAPDRAVSRYLVDLPASGSSDLLLDAALAAGVAVLELEPLAS
jgi:ABC-type multidrug transport system ATPase subunit